MIDPRELEVGDHVLVLSRPCAHVTAIVHVMMGRAYQMRDAKSAVAVGIVKHGGREGHKTMIYVRLDANDEQIAVPASRVRLIRAPANAQ